MRLIWPRILKYSVCYKHCISDGARTEKGSAITVRSFTQLLISNSTLLRWYKVQLRSSSRNGAVYDAFFENDFKEIELLHSKTLAKASRAVPSIPMNNPTCDKNRSNLACCWIYSKVFALQHQDCFFLIQMISFKGVIFIHAKAKFSVLIKHD